MRRLFHKNRSGTVTVEMAFVAPVIFLLIFGQIEMSRMMMIRQSVTNASREGSRHACLITTKSSKDVVPVVQNMLAPVIGRGALSDSVEIKITPEFDDGLEPETMVEVQVFVDFQKVSWLPPFFAKNAKIHGAASMARE